MILPCKEWFRRCTVVYLVMAPGAVLLLIPWVPLPVIGALIILHAALFSLTFIPNGAWFAPIVRRFATDKKEVFLTLDDGPDLERTPRVLELLANHGAKACFFVIGRKVRANPELARAIVAQGHELGNHTDTHREHWFWSYLWRGVARELEGCSRVIKETTGFQPRWFRSPVGWTSPFVYPAARALGLRMLGWSAWARDATAHDTDAAVDRILTDVRPGAVLVLHPELTGLACLEKVLAKLKQLGYRCVLPDNETL